MYFVKTGIVLKTENYHECVDFYHNVLGLTITEPEKVEDDFRMSVLDFGASYLMIETGGLSHQVGKDVSKNPIVLRFDVRCAKRALRKLLRKNIGGVFYQYDWADLVIAYDPDGNRIELKQPKKH